MGTIGRDSESRNTDNVPIRVAQILGRMDCGGVESVVMSFYRNIDRSKIQFDFIVDEDSSSVPEDEIAALGGRVFRIPSYADVLHYQSALNDLFEAERWPIVHSHLNSLSVFPLRAAKRMNVPVRIAHSHSTSGKGEFARNAMKSVLKKLSNRYPTDRLACSVHAGRWLFGSSPSFTVLHNAIDLNEFAYSEESRRGLRKRYGIDADTFVVGCVGRLVTQKNPMFLLKVFTSIKELVPDSKLMIVGEGNLREQIESEVGRCGLEDDVILTGNLSDVGQAYSAFDVFVLPSLYEGLGIVCIEAQSNGLKCYVSDQVPAEAQITDLVEFLPLDIGPEMWAKAIVDARKGKRHDSPVDFDQFAEYDIGREACKLADFYLDLYDREVSIS